MSEAIRFARRVSLRVKPDKVNEFLSTMREKVYPGLSKEKGVRRVYLLRDTGKQNEFASLTLWNSRSDADAYESTGHYSANRDMVREYLEEDPSVTQFDVEYHTVSPALRPPVASRKKRTRARRTKRPARRRRR